MLRVFYHITLKLMAKSNRENGCPKLLKVIRYGAALTRFRRRPSKAGLHGQQSHISDTTATDFLPGIIFLRVKRGVIRLQEKTPLIPELHA